MTDIAMVRMLEERDAEIERLRAEAANTIEHLRFTVLTVDKVNGRLHAALHNIGIGGNGERNWTLDEVRAVAWDALAGKDTA